MLGRLIRMQQQQTLLTWPGGLAFHQDAFTPLARMLLVLHSCAALDLRPACAQPAAGNTVVTAEGAACSQPMATGSAAGRSEVADEFNAASAEAPQQSVWKGCGGSIEADGLADGIRRCAQAFLALPLQPLLGNMLLQVTLCFLKGGKTSPSLMHARGTAAMP